MEKEQILSQIGDFTAEQLFVFKCEGKVTRNDLMSTGNFEEVKRTKFDQLQKSHDQKDDLDWEKYRGGNESFLDEYIRNYPSGRHIVEANEKIEVLKKQRDKAESERQRILDNLSKNPNSYTPGMINGYLEKGIVTKEDLYKCDIPANIIDTINNIHPPRLQLGATPDSIPDGFTEVYFWGLPGSGKTCALAAILSTAEQAGYLDLATGPGYDYMTRLKNIFIESNAILPPPSPVETTQYLPFALKKKNEKPRSVSLIELSGEIFQCFYYKNAGKSLPSQSHQDTFDTLINFLNGKNRKIHFFFIDFEKENRIDADGYRQGDYLNAASIFFKNKDIFGKSTDAVYIVITKSDLMPCRKDEQISYSKKHLEDHNFSSFINALKERCKQHSINAGKLTIEPFSLGKVYFQQICDFDKTSASKIIDILIDRIPPNKKSILDIFNK